MTFTDSSTREVTLTMGYVETQRYILLLQFLIKLDLAIRPVLRPNPQLGYSLRTVENLKQ